MRKSETEEEEGKDGESEEMNEWRVEEGGEKRERRKK